MSNKKHCTCDKPFSDCIHAMETPHGDKWYCTLADKPKTINMNKKQLLEILEIQDIHDLPSALQIVLSKEAEERDLIYQKLIELNDFDLSKDWFQSIYEGELAQRNENKQDFTPNTIGVILSRLTGNEIGEIYEPTAGNGSLLIANWWYRKNTVKAYKSEEHPVACWELSSRSIPILLLNLSIRGIVGIVRHGNVLTQETTSIYNLEKSNNNYSTITKQS